MGIHGDFMNIFWIQWDFHGISMGFPWEFSMGISRGF
jgi:hypothetical protein